MKKKNEPAKENLTDKKEIWTLLIMIPIMFLIMIVLYFGLSKLSIANSRVCTFMGKLWISQAQMTATLPEGCYTYRELAQIKFEDDK